MDVEQARERYFEAARDVKKAFDELTIQQRRNPRSARQKRIVAERMLWVMQRKITIERMGVSIDEARELANSGVFAAHANRHRQLETLVLRGVR